MQLTRAADYAVRVMIHLAAAPEGTRESRENLAQAGDIPSHFLSKILQSLARCRFITSHRGVSGGFQLLCDPNKTTMLEIVEAVEGPLWLNACVTPGQGCTHDQWCAAHGLWAEAQREVIRVLRSATLADLACESQRRRTECGRCALDNVLQIQVNPPETKPGEIDRRR